MNLQTLQRQSDDIIHDTNNARQQLTFGQDRLKQIIERTLPSIKAELKELSEQILDFAPETMAIFKKRHGKYRNTADTIVFDEPEPTDDQA